MQKKRLIIAGVFLFFLVSGFWYFLQENKGVTKEEALSSVFSQTQQQENKLNEDEGITQEKSEIEDLLLEESSKETENFIFVYVCGAVQNAGVYSLVEGERLYMAIELAGGFTKEAAKEYHNLARIVEDGERIYILTKKELEELSIKEQITGELGVEEQIEQQQVVNLNTASLEELTTLPGIGESKAKLIMEYRITVGKFKSIEELMNVSGIGEAMFAKVKDRITIE